MAPATKPSNWLTLLNSTLGVKSGRGSLADGMLLGVPTDGLSKKMSFRNAAPRREHWERGQLANRGKLGLLEKKRDYLLRAKDYHAKEKRLAILREKARFRNPDEFYFAMHSSATMDGIHKMKRARPIGPDGSPYSDDMIHLLKTQDWNYLRNQVLIEQNKIESLEDEHPWLRYLDRTSSTLKGKHIVFEGDEPSRTPHGHSEGDSDVEPPSPVLRDVEDLHVKKGFKGKISSEWSARKGRLSQMIQAEKELYLKNQLSTSKGRRKKVGKDAAGTPIYKWNTRRNK
jgi:U3 small nucleolar RNA-associated protein 11